MTNQIQSIPLAQLIPHPDNPNRMSRVTFAKLVRNIGQTGRYEPLIVRRITDIKGHISENITNLRRNTYESDIYQIINGHHRWQALKKLGKETADAVVWDIDDDQTDILLATLNRLCGQDVLDKKLALLKRLSERAKPAELAKLLPQTKTRLEKLINLDSQQASLVRCRFGKGGSFANPLIFFVSDDQKQIIENALSLVKENKNEKTKAAKKAAALTNMARYFLDNRAS